MNTTPIELNDAAIDDLAGLSELTDLPDHALISETQLARLLGRHPVSVKRAVDREELPPATRLMGKPVWTLRSIRAHIESRLDSAQEDANSLRNRLEKNGLRER